MKAAATTLRVPVLEVFSTFQGEGPRVGERQIFVRLAGCDLRCAYCDTPESYPIPKAARVQEEQGREGDRWVENPMEIAAVLGALEQLDQPRGLHAAVSITGGEPLLYPGPVRALAEGAHTLGLGVHVETGGHRPSEVREVIDIVDSFSPDLKLASATGFPTPWSQHEATFRALERHRKALAVKVVVSARTPPEEIAEAARFAARHLPSAPLYLQPATPREGEGIAPSLPHLLALHQAAAVHHPAVRLLPQVHRFTGWR